MMCPAHMAHCCISYYPMECPLVIIDNQDKKVMP